MFITAQNARRIGIGGVRLSIERSRNDISYFDIFPLDIAKAKIGEFHMSILPNEDIIRFYVSMNDAVSKTD